MASIIQIFSNGACIYVIPPLLSLRTWVEISEFHDHHHPPLCLILVIPRGVCCKGWAFRSEEYLRWVGIADLPY
jgi:hypothetical protein